MIGEFTKGLFKQNPVFVLMLGLCPVLAVTTGAINACYMALAATAVLVSSNTLISLLRRYFPKEIRIPCFIVIIASLVTMVELGMAGFAPPEVNASLSIFIPLIVVNCIILGRAEAFASKHSVARSVFDGLGIGVGFFLALLVISLIREVLGSGRLFGLPLFGEGTAFQPQSIMVMAPGAFLAIGALFGLFAWRGQAGRAKRRQAAYASMIPPKTASDFKTASEQ